MCPNAGPSLVCGTSQPHAMGVRWVPVHVTAQGDGEDPHFDPKELEWGHANRSCIGLFM